MSGSIVLFDFPQYLIFSVTSGTRVLICGRRFYVKGQ